MNDSVVYFRSAEGLGIKVQDVLSSRGAAAAWRHGHGGARWLRVFAQCH